MNAATFSTSTDRLLVTIKGRAAEAVVPSDLPVVISHEEPNYHYTDDALVAMATTADAAMEYILGGGWKGVWGFSAARGEWVRFDWICPR